MSGTCDSGQSNRIDLFESAVEAYAVVPIIGVVLLFLVGASYGTFVRDWFTMGEFVVAVAATLPLLDVSRRVFRYDFAFRAGLGIAGVVLLGSVGSAAVFVLVIRLEQASGVVISDASTLVATALFAGAMVSGPLAYQAARLRGISASLEREVDERSRLVTRLSVTDRILRHNLRNRLTVIRGHTELLVEQAEAGLVDQHVSPIANAAAELQTLAEQASRIQRLFDGESTGEQSLSACLHAIAATGTAETTNCTCIVDCPDELVVRARPELQDALSTLVTTLCETTVDEDGRVELHARADSAASVRLRITLSTNVPKTVVYPLYGEPEEALAHADDLGVWYVYWVVDLSGGRCTVTSGESETQISITLPAAETT